MTAVVCLRGESEFSWYWILSGKGIGETNGPLAPGQVVREPSVNGSNIGAGIECEPDEVLEIQDRGATLTHAEVDGSRGKQRT